MKIARLSLLLLSVLLIFAACEKEKSFETGGSPSAGFLQSDISGDCLPKTIGGIFEEGTALDPAASYIDVEVDVTKTGNYLIYTDTVNGFYFRANGTFTTTGTNTVRLKANGTPAADGIHNFTVTYTTTECVVPVTVLPAGGASPATFTFTGAPNECMDFVLSGDYTIGVAMTLTNTVVIKVDVTDPGTYSITTALSNGMSFAGSGTLAAGAQTITLTATGTPVAGGSSNFAVTVGASTCTFVVDVQNTSDYFPRDAGSNWSYEYDGDANDSLLIRAKTGTVILGGQEYNEFEATINAAAGFGNWGNYRRAGGNYFTYADMGAYFQLDNPVEIEYIFLKDNVPAAAQWQSDPINGTITDTSGTFPISIRLAFTIEQKDAAVTVGGTAYNNVIVVVEKYEVFDGTAWVDVTDQVGYFKTYYARDIGMIKQDYYYEDGNANPPVSEELDIRRHQVF